MSFLPIGPDFVFAPRDANFKRLSLRNEEGRQGLVSQIAVDSNDPNNIFIVVRPSTSGASVFRTNDGGASWTAIFDSLLRSNPGFAQAFSLALNPVNSSFLYVGTDSGGVFVSPDRGSTWGPRSTIGTGGVVRKLLVDPRTAADPATTVLFAATSQGIFRSSDGGSSWTSVLQGNVTTIAASFPAVGNGDFYASVWQTGLFHASDPTGSWTNLNSLNIGLPARDNLNNAFDDFATDICRSAPNRVYAWMAMFNKTLGLFTSTSPLTNWTRVQANSLPNPGQGLYSFGLAVTPNSPGDGANDILFFPGTHLSRSIDGGKTWIDASGMYNAFHDDQHSVAFAPDPAPPGVIPGTYIGCDGGLGFSDQFADPAFAFGAVPADFDESTNYTDAGSVQNLNHALQSSAIIRYASDPRLPALSYIACQDTSIAGGSGVLGWRGLDNADSYNVAVAPGADGMKVWYYFAVPNYIKMMTDKGGFNNPIIDSKLSGNGPLMVCKSDTTPVGLDQKVICGVWLRDDSGNKLTAAVQMTGSQAATPASMTNITVGTAISVDDGSANNAETVTVTAITNTTFTANFTKTHKVGANVVLQRFPVVRIDQNSVATQISQDFGPMQPIIVATSPTAPIIMYCATSDQRLWTTNAGVTAGPNTVWAEITGGKPSGVQMSSIVIDNAGNTYVLCSASVSVGAGEFQFTTPLFLISGGNWMGQSCVNLPSPDFGKMVADPVQQDILYVQRSNSVFSVVKTAMGWQWTDISDGLPGTPLYDLWVGNIGTANAPKVLLRTAATTRGVFERDVTVGASDPKTALYVRANFLDLALLDSCPNGVTNPFDPTNPGVTVFHYQCADVKVDVQRAEGFFQNDPEGPVPIPHVLFDQLKDNSENLPQSDTALVHVQVHNRSNAPADNVRVWAIYSNASAGVPALNVSASSNNSFPFWKQFLLNGKINNNLPKDSPWKEIGPPQLLSGITVGTPKVASWNWTIPKLPNGDPGHYCIAVFIHSASSPLSDTSMDVDDLAKRKKRVGLKNLHIGPPLPAGGDGGGNSGSGGNASGSNGNGGAAARQMREYVEFHNPTGVMRQTTLVFDFRGLPPELKVTFRLSHLQTAHPLTNSMTGAAPRSKPITEQIVALIDQWLEDPIEHALKPGFDFFEDLLEEWLCGRREEPRRTLPLGPTIYEADPSEQVRIDGVNLPPFGICAAEITVRNLGSLPPGSDYWFQVQQWVNTQVAGGSLYKVRIAGTRAQTVYTPPPLPDEDTLRNDPLWARDLIAEEMKLRFKQS